MADQQLDARVDSYLERAATFAQPILVQLRKLMASLAEGQRIDQMGMPFFPQQGIILGNMAASKAHCAFGFWGPGMQKSSGQRRAGRECGARFSGAN